MSKLIEGFIPPKTACPFKSKCPLVPVCKHKGIHNTVQFSCSHARTLDAREAIGLPNRQQEMASAMIRNCVAIKELGELRSATADFTIVKPRKLE